MSKVKYKFNKKSLTIDRVQTTVRKRLFYFFTHLSSGVLFAAVITRFSSLLDGIYRGFLRDPQYVPLVEKDLKTGQHRSGDTHYFTTAYLHHPKEVSEEVKASGLTPVALLAIEGPVWHDGCGEDLKKDPQAWEMLLHFLEMVESDEFIIGTSCHIMSVSKKARL